MTLTARLLTFFLAALAVVLLGFSVAIYLLAHTYLHRQLDERLAAALDTLAAATEVGPEGVEWEPHERTLTLGLDPGVDQVRWMISDTQGRVVDRSHNLAAAELPRVAEEDSGADVLWQRQPWRVVRREIAASRPDLPVPKGQSGRPAAKQPVLVLTAGLSLEPVRAVLRELTADLALVAVGLWVAAALLGWWLCRRALAAVTRMAAAARGISAEALDRRLPDPGTADELGELSQAFNGLLARLQEAFERQRRFTGDASHQLRTPLTAVLGQVEVALRHEREPAEYRRVLWEVLGQARHLRHLVESLLYLARADAEALLSDLEPLELHTWLADYLRSWSGHERAAEFRVQRSADGALWVGANGPLLGQLVGNLLDNACKHSPPGSGIALRVEEDGEVCLSVEDAGCGVAAEDLPHVFEPFYRSASARREGLAGVGLGLSVARRIAAAFGGALGVQNNSTGGATFTLRLPRANAATGKE